MASELSLPQGSLRQRHRSPALPLRFWLMCIAATILNFLLLLCRMRYTGQAGHLSLIWDVFLGWFPMAPALWAYWYAGKPKRWVSLIALALLGWLVFFPNAPYLVTELIHLHPEFGGSQRPMPDWLTPLFPTGQLRDPPNWLEFLLLSSTAGCGVLLTLGGLFVVQRTIGVRFAAPKTAAAFVFVAASLSGLGVAIGRWDRFNSWDLVRRPMEILERMEPRFLEPMEHPKLLMTAGVMAVLTLTVYFGAMALGSAREDERAAE